MAMLEDVLGQYNQSNFDIGSAAALIRQLGQQVGLTEDELAAAVPVFGNEHRAAYNSGYTEGSNYSAVAQRAVADALDARGVDSSRFKQATQGFVDQGAQQAQQRWQATQKPDGGLLGGLGPISKIAALFPGPQQPFLLAANAANSLSQGNLVGAGLNALGAYGGFTGGYNPGAGGENALSAQEFAANAGVGANPTIPSYLQPMAGGTADTGYGAYRGGTMDNFDPVEVNLGEYQSFSPGYTGDMNLGEYQSFPAADGASGQGMLQRLMSATGLSEKQLTGLGSAGLQSLASLYGARQVGRAATNAANIGVNAADRATALQTQIYQDQLSRSQPFYEAGVNALGPYTKGIMPGGDLVRPFSLKDFTADPGQEYRTRMGLDAITKSRVAQGLGQSGKTYQDLMRAGQEYAAQGFGNRENAFYANQATQRNALAGLTGFAPTAAQQIGAAGTNYANTAGNLGINTATNYANADLTSAAARQSAYGGAGGAFNEAFNPDPRTAFYNNMMRVR